MKYKIMALALVAFGLLLMTHAVNAGTTVASWYGSESAGGPTACGYGPYDPSGLSAAHRTLPCGTRLLVRHEGRGVTVTVTDRGPAPWTGHDLDLSEAAASSIGLKEEGTGEVEISEVPSSTSEKLPDTSGDREILHGLR